MVGPSGKGKEKEPKERKKPGRIPTSCAECRRLKLRCDKNTPCSKCVSRGCESICPNGSLTPGKGNRLVLSGTEELHDKIDQMASRNRELENALRDLQKKVSDDSHPLLSTELLGINLLQGSSTRASSSSTARTPPGAISPSTHQPPNPMLQDIYEEDGSAQFLGSLYVDKRNETRHFGKTTCPEYLLRSENDLIVPPKPSLSSSILKVAIPENVLDIGLAATLRSSLPPRNEATRLWAVYLEYGKFLYEPVSETDVPNYLFTSVDNCKSPADCLDDIALIFSIFALGALFDPKPDHLILAQDYYAYSRAALNMCDASTGSSLQMVQTMIHLSQFVFMTDATPVGSDKLWAHLGHAVRLSYKMGLHLDSTHWKLPEDLVQQRHEVFWSLFVVDTWISIAAGRPPSILKSHVTCPCPRKKRGSSAIGSGPEYHSWRGQMTCLIHTISEVALGPRMPIYSVILNFDRAIRDLEVPASWQMPSSTTGESAPSADIIIHRWLVLSAKELTILNLHRPYFVLALQELPEDLQKHRFFPSVIATFKAAWRLMNGFAELSRVAFEFLCRVNSFWSSVMSAAIATSLLVTKAPVSHWACPALEELDQLASLFESASSRCPTAANFYPSLEALQIKAHDAMGDPLLRAHYPQHARTMTTPEVERLNGQTALISEQYLPSPRSTLTVSTILPDSRQPPSFSINDLEGLHPSLAYDVEEYRLRNAISSHSSFQDSPVRSAEPQRLPQPSASHSTSQSSSRATTSTLLSAAAHVSPVSSPLYSSRQTQELPQLRVPSRNREYYQPPYTTPPSLHASFTTSSMRNNSNGYSPQSQVSSSYEPSSLGGYPSHPISPSLPPWPSQQTYMPPTITLPAGFQPSFQTHAWPAHSPFALDQSWAFMVEQAGY